MPRVSAGEVISIAAAGMAAGAINTIVGSGTLITFPVLLALGYAPVTANVSNTVGLVPGSASGAIGYRRELAGQRRRALRLGTMSVLGGVTGAVLLLVLPASTFEAIVPVFIALALTLTLLQPRLDRWLAGHQVDLEHCAWALIALLVYLTGVYGGYFGAAQGILLLAILGVSLSQSLQRTNALKNVLAGLVNGVAGVYFALAAHVDWGPAAIIAATSIVGAQIGARYGRRMSPALLRAVIVIVGVSAIVRLVLT
ncbi:MAG TPA: sulfite exporter TauE/SafE family protein [Solirubrobacteraceae bacterium]|nr:sulfite exporter TauE/SafE family protein [Solirubrobacteraceae bacterium]